MRDFSFECNIHECPYDYICESEDFESSDCEHYMRCTYCYNKMDCPLEFFNQECEQFR